MAKCPDKSPVLCGPQTISRGLCVPKQEDCDSRSNSLRNIPILEVNPLSAKYGYRNSPDLGKHCYYTNHTMTLNYQRIFGISKGDENIPNIDFKNVPDDMKADTVPENFSCLTYNIWGLAKNADIQRLFDLRKPLLEKTIRSLNADILCLQEISSFAYEKLKGLFSEYKFASEIPYPGNAGKRRNRGVDVYFLSKYRPKAIYIYGLEGVLGYANALMAIEYPNLVVFNLYGQAGSKSSPGQAEKWLHYSRCRYDILQSIRDLMQSTFSDAKQFIVCGDLNFHLDGSLDDWPEIAMINQLKQDGFVDSYRQINKDPGFTEDTDLNKMRWNQKLIEKFYRFDAILYKGPLTVKKSEIIGLEEECLSQADSEWFIDKLSDAKGGREGELKRCKHGTLPINPSDHFGVLTHFGPTKGGRRVTRRISKMKCERTSRKNSKLPQFKANKCPGKVKKGKDGLYRSSESNSGMWIWKKC